MNVTATNSLTEQRNQILDAVSVDVERPIVSRSYVFGLLVTASVLLLLPLLYFMVLALVPICLIALIRQTRLFSAGGNQLVAGLLLSIVTLAAIVFVFGLVKPFLAPTTAAKRPRTLRRETEPFLYQYIDRLCDMLGAPRPTAIHVTCDVNAAAELRRHWPNVFRTKGISLHLGLPLVAGLSIQQFTGVLVHELGHFTQRTAMWLEHMVQRTNHFFWRAGCGRDSVDDWLVRQSAIRGPIAILFLFVRGIVWLSRVVLFGLAIAGTAISCLMSREMEFNADRCQVRIVGPGTFASALWRLRELTVAHQSSFRDVVAFFDEGRLPDDLIALSVANATFVSPKVKKKLRQMWHDRQTGTFDSHPSDQDRIRAAEKDGSPGILPTGYVSADIPASILFNHFQEVSKAVTDQFYQAAFRQKITPRILHSVDRLLERQKVELEAARALRRYFQVEIPRLRPLPIAAQSCDPPENPKSCAVELNACRQRMLHELPTYRRLIPRYRQAEETLLETIAAQTLSQARIPFDPKEYHLSDTNTDTISEKQSRARDGVAHLAGKLLPFETEGGNRLSFAMQLLHVPSVVKRISNGEDLYYEVRELLPTAQYVSRLIGELPSLGILFFRLAVLFEQTRQKKASERILEMIMSHIQSLRSRLITIQNEMGSHWYPFDHADAEMTLRAYALPLIPGEQDLAGIVQATEQMQSRLIAIQMRLFARLAFAAEKIENAIGMTPLPEPQNSNED